MTIKRLAPDGVVEIHYEIALDGREIPPAEHDIAPLKPIPSTIPPIDYKPGWTFSWELRSRLYLCLRIRRPDVKAIDCDTGADRPISWRWEVPLPVTTQWIWQTITGIERHTRGEWLQIGGRRVMDPHDPDSNYFARNHQRSARLLLPH